MNGSHASQLRKLTRSSFPPRRLFAGPTGGAVTDRERRVYQNAKKVGKGIPAKDAVAIAEEIVSQQGEVGKLIKRRHTQANAVNRSILKKRQDAAKKKQQRNNAAQTAHPRTDNKPFMQRAKNFIGSMFGRKGS